MLATDCDIVSLTGAAHPALDIRAVVSRSIRIKFVILSMAVPTEIYLQTWQSVSTYPFVFSFPYNGFIRLRYGEHPWQVSN